MVENSYHFSVNNLSCRRGGRQVFSALSFELSPSEALLVSGANGSGKTSLLRMLAGLLPSEKMLTFANGEQLSQQAHFTGSKDGAKAHLSVRENLSFWRDMLDGTGDIDRIMQIFSLENLRDMPAQLLSSGQRQRLALSRLFVAQRCLWLLDEPASALDTQNRERLDAALARHLHSGGMAIISAHGDINIPNAKMLTLGVPA